MDDVCGDGNTFLDGKTSVRALPHHQTRQLTTAGSGRATQRLSQTQSPESAADARR